MKHRVGADGRCEQTDLLPRECSGCRGDDESFAMAVLKSEPVEQVEDPYDWPPPVDDVQPPGSEAPHVTRPRPVKWWLDTGVPSSLAAIGPVVIAHYSGGRCQARCSRRILKGQPIVQVNVGGYAHLACMSTEEQAR